MDKGMTMQGLGVMAVGILGLIVIFTIIPIVGSELDSAVTLGATSDWNATHNTAVPTGISLWTSLGGILKVGAIVIVIAGFLRTLQGMRS